MKVCRLIVRALKSHRSIMFNFPKISASVILVPLLLVMVSFATIQKDSPTQAVPSPTSETPDVDRVITEFTKGETEFRTAFGHYGYKCELVIQTVKNGIATGEYRRTTQVVLGKDRKLQEQVLSFPRPSVTEIVVTRQDLENLSANYQFTLGTANAGKYKFTYAGNERISNIDLYLFDVKPKELFSKELLFDGRVWVSVKDLRVVKMRGRGVAKGNQSFPILEISRSAVDSRYLFPSYAFADEELKFKTGASVHLLIEVKYTDYVKLL